MVEQKAALTYSGLLTPATGHPEHSRSGPSEHRLQLAVVFTSFPATITALRHAGSLADRLGARITLVVPQVVPFPLPLDHPPVSRDFNEQRFGEIAVESPVETAVQIYLCRDRLEVLKAVLRPHSLVVVGGRKRWWPNQERTLARRLRRAGHEVVFTEME